MQETISVQKIKTFILVLFTWNLGMIIRVIMHKTYVCQEPLPEGGREGNERRIE